MTQNKGVSTREPGKSCLIDQHPNLRCFWFCNLRAEGLGTIIWKLQSSPVGVRLPDDELDLPAVHGGVFAGLVQPEPDRVGQKQGVRSNRPILAGNQIVLEVVGNR